MTNSGITRRRILRSAATGGLAVAAASGAVGAARAQSARKTFVLSAGLFAVAGYGAGSLIGSNRAATKYSLRH